MELRPYADEDRWLTEALETDETVMAELGGGWPPDAIDGIHARRLAAVAAGNWAFVVVPAPGARPVGTINLWHGEHEGQVISELGWMILPAHQGRGYATSALAEMIARARADGRWGDLHAFTSTTNVPSNALCRRAGFELVETVDVDYADRILHCHHWRLPAP